MSVPLECPHCGATFDEPDQWQLEADCFVRNFSERAAHWDDHFGDLVAASVAEPWIDPDHPDPELDAAYRSGILPPEQRFCIDPADVEIVVTFFPDKRARIKTEQLISLRRLVDLIRVTSAPRKHDLPLIKLARFGDGMTDAGSRRFNANLIEISGVELDYDGKKVTLDCAVDIAEAARLLAIIYSSPSHRPDAPRWRILAPTSRELAPDERDTLVARINGAFSGIFGVESWTLSQSYYIGQVGKNSAHRVELIDGEPIDLLEGLDTIAIGKPGSDKPKPAENKPARAIGLSRYGEAAVDKACRNIIAAPVGEQERTLNREAYSIGRLAGTGAIPVEFARRVLLWGARKISDFDTRRPWGAKELEQKITRAFEAGLRNPREAQRA